jgi:hypothetical protein
MSHDELLAKIESFNKVTTEGMERRALRAVVELHKPIDAGEGLSQVSRDILGYTNVCGECHYSGGIYPCDTIKAIEKELQ